MAKNKFIENVLKDLKNTSYYLSEAYIFNEDIPGGSEYGYEGDLEGAGEPNGMTMGNDPTMMQQQPQMAQNGAGMGQTPEEQAMHAQEIIQHEPIIGKIRETAIDGLKKYADHPTSSLYEFFKFSYIVLFLIKIF